MEHIDIHCPSIPVKNRSNFGKEHERYSCLFIFVPEMRQIIHIAEGDGSNLSTEDIENGYVDYIYYDQYELVEDITEVDGGQILLTEPLRDKYCYMVECIPDVLDMAYGCMAGFIILDEWR